MNSIIKLDFKTIAAEPEADPVQRMISAVDKMAGENTKFQASMVEFKEVMGELERRMNTLGNSCWNFQRKLGQINVKPIRRSSLRLARIMDDGLNGQPANAA
jgi:hypothetical protein